jgi:hypothetical protein
MQQSTLTRAFMIFIFRQGNIIWQTPVLAAVMLASYHIAGIAITWQNGEELQSGTYIFRLRA